MKHEQAVNAQAHNNVKSDIKMAQICGCFRALAEVVERGGKDLNGKGC